MAEKISPIEPISAIRKVPSSPQWDPLRRNPIPTDSSMSSSKKQRGEYLSSQPQLAPPNPFGKTLSLFESKIESLAAIRTLSREKEIEKTFHSIDQSHQEEGLLLEKTSQSTKDVTFWGILEDLSHSVLGSLFFLAGTSALSAGATATGGGLIVSGVLSISQLYMKHVKVWDWMADSMAKDHQTLHKAIQTYLPAAFGIATAALGIYGSYWGWSSVSQTGSNLASTLLEGTSTITKGLLAFGGGLSQYQLRTFTGQLDHLHSKAELSIIDLDQLTQDVEDFEKKQKQYVDLLGKIVEQTDQAIQIIHQPV